MQGKYLLTRATLNLVKDISRMVMMKGMSLAQQHKVFLTGVMRTSYLWLNHATVARNDVGAEYYCQDIFYPGELCFINLCIFIAPCREKKTLSYRKLVNRPKYFFSLECQSSSPFAGCFRVNEIIFLLISQPIDKLLGQG